MPVRLFLAKVISLTTTSTVLVSWPYPSEGFSLQQDGALGTANWVRVTNAPMQVGQEWQLIAQPQAGNKFYRLLEQAHPDPVKLG
jgi:hypothetical protein